ncbi:phosphate ABC transporter permease PstA [Teredinibacter waterburyi]|uniref:phosphate ABC transporter permease PstA n=1 Tax=Teredinibacter waterburyi TaxID=1500538 RepID=UPI001CAA8646|nr:phosphate ABC transporter permease PstA [Teredinibacter waterburyi]
MERNLKRRYRSERRFKAFGIASIGVGLLALLVLFTEIIGTGMGAFRQTYVTLEVTYDTEVLGIEAVTPESLALANFDGIVRRALLNQLPEVTGRTAKRQLYALISYAAGYQLRAMLEQDPSLLGETRKVTMLADDDLDTYVKSVRADDPFIGRLSEPQVEWINQLEAQGLVELKFNTNFFTSGDSSEPEQAGILGAVMGSLFTLIVTLALSFPIGVAAAIYLEEYASRNRFTDFIEVNINNLAAVPSVIFGLLGLAIFLNFFHFPRSVPLVGGLVLTLMTLPTIIISSRAAIKSVPPSIREAALGMGASKMQMILQHVLPLAMPGMLTGAIIGMAQALGETAPLLMIGMVAFIADVPGGITDPATVLPVQIFLWADSPERAFVERTSAAIMVLLAFLITMNTMAIWLRKRLERRW